jgi:hypothetical protein
MEYPDTVNQLVHFDGFLNTELKKMNNIKFVVFFYMCTQLPQSFDLESKSPLTTLSSGEALYWRCETGRSMPRERKCDCSIDRQLSRQAVSLGNKVACKLMTFN